MRFFFASGCAILSVSSFPPLKIYYESQLARKRARETNTLIIDCCWSILLFADPLLLLLGSITQHRTQLSFRENKQKTVKWLPRVLSCCSARAPQSILFAEASWCQADDDDEGYRRANPGVERISLKFLFLLPFWELDLATAPTIPPEILKTPSSPFFLFSLFFSAAVIVSSRVIPLGKARAAAPGCSL